MPVLLANLCSFGLYDSVSLLRGIFLFHRFFVIVLNGDRTFSIEVLCDPERLVQIEGFQISDRTVLISSWKVTGSRCIWCQNAILITIYIQFFRCESVSSQTLWKMENR